MQQQGSGATRPPLSGKPLAPNISIKTHGRTSACTHKNHDDGGGGGDDDDNDDDGGDDDDDEEEKDERYDEIMIMMRRRRRKKVRRYLHARCTSRLYNRYT